MRPTHGTVLGSCPPGCDPLPAVRPVWPSRRRLLETLPPPFDQSERRPGCGAGFGAGRRRHVGARPHFLQSDPGGPTGPDLSRVNRGHLPLPWEMTRRMPSDWPTLEAKIEFLGIFVKVAEGRFDLPLALR